MLWTQKGQTINGAAVSVSLSSDGSIVATGMEIYKYNNTYPNSNDWKWEYMGVGIVSENAYDLTGQSVSLSSDGLTVAIGARENDGNGNNSGHVRVYKYISGSWTQKGADIDGEAANDQSGTSVSLSSDGSIVAIGAPLNDGNGNDSGHVRVYKYNNTYSNSNDWKWEKMGQDINGEVGYMGYEKSGYSVSLSSDGSIVAIGAPYRQIYGYGYVGRVRVYQYNTSFLVWQQMGLGIDGELSDKSGWSVSLSSDGLTLAIGSPNNWDYSNMPPGRARIYKYITGSWTKIREFIGENNNDQTGNVSLSSDGLSIVIGSAAYSGYVRVYKFTPQIVSPTEISYLDGVTAPIQGQISTEASTARSAESIISADG